MVKIEPYFGLHVRWIQLTMQFFLLWDKLQRLGHVAAAQAISSMACLETGLLQVVSCNSTLKEKYQVDLVSFQKPKKFF